MASSFEGKSVIVTGAGYGVGLAIARRFAESGARVMFAGRDEEKLEKEVTLLEGEAPGAVQYYAGDISQKLGIKAPMIQGRRITSPDMLKVALMVYGGLMNRQLVATLQALGA
ncbi:MAG: SDR family NAD(P)-dependent oxidoreductase, partial [Pseudomonadota bacterium]